MVRPRPATDLGIRLISANPVTQAGAEWPLTVTMTIAGPMAVETPVVQVDFPAANLEAVSVQPADLELNASPGSGSATVRWAVYR